MPKPRMRAGMSATANIHRQPSMGVKITPTM
jgi:hypothetical protein